MSSPRPGRLVVDAGALPAGAATVDALAVLQLAAKRLGLEARLRDAPSDLVDLIGFVGLAEVLRLEAEGKPEEREERLGVEEERELDDPPRL
jgi:hypothetical protein